MVHVTDRWPPGAGPRADAMVTDRPDIALGIVTADCAPVLFADPRAGVVGAAHAGWRGAVAGVIEATIAAMARLGATPASTVAAIGPCIRQPSYEVGADLRDAVLAHEPPAIASSPPAGARRAGSSTCPAIAPRAWPPPASERRNRRCRHAADEARFFSHRRRTLAGGGPIGHQISIIALEPR